MKRRLVWTAGALAGLVQPAHSLHVETPDAGEGAGGPDLPQAQRLKTLGQFALAVRMCPGISPSQRV